MAEVEDSSTCITAISWNIGVAASECGCTDPSASNYDSTATIDDGSCLYSGCTDPNASNYDPNATSDDCSCEYDPFSASTTHCVPPHIQDLINKLKVCIVENGYNFYYAVISGRADDCSIMNVWKLILLDYLIDPIGLDCIYNCADSETPSADELKTCHEQWVTGGPATGINDMAQSGSTITTGEGTTIVTPSTFFSASNTLYPGDIIKMPSGIIWIVNGPGLQYNNNMLGFHANGADPETYAGQKMDVWTQCKDSMHQISSSDSTNYLDNFSSFVNKFCADCNIEDSSQINTLGYRVSSSNTSASTLQIASALDLDGENIDMFLKSTVTLKVDYNNLNKVITEAKAKGLIDPKINNSIIEKELKSNKRLLDKHFGTGDWPSGDNYGFPPKPPGWLSCKCAASEFWGVCVAGACLNHKGLTWEV